MTPRAALLAIPLAACAAERPPAPPLAIAPVPVRAAPRPATLAPMTVEQDGRQYRLDARARAPRKDGGGVRCGDAACAAGEICCDLRLDQHHPFCIAPRPRQRVADVCVEAVLDRDPDEIHLLPVHACDSSAICGAGGRCCRQEYPADDVDIDACEPATNGPGCHELCTADATCSAGRHCEDGFCELPRPDVALDCGPATCKRGEVCCVGAKGPVCTTATACHTCDPGQAGQPGCNVELACTSSAQCRADEYCLLMTLPGIAACLRDAMEAVPLCRSDADCTRWCADQGAKRARCAPADGGAWRTCDCS